MQSLAPNSLMTEFYFSRHGETDFNLKGMVSGTRDVELNETGRALALSLSGEIARIGVKSCAFSPLKRAQDTAELLLQKSLDVKLTVIEELKERHWGRLEGISKTKIEEHDFDQCGVEEWEKFVERSYDGLLKINEAVSEGSLPLPLLIVAHSGTYRAFCEALKINIVKRPVRNVLPYRFYCELGEWKVTESL